MGRSSQTKSHLWLIPSYLGYYHSLRLNQRSYLDMRDHIKSLTLNVDSASMVHNVAEKKYL